MYDNPSLPYRCPICLQSVSPCTEDATTGKRTCGCLTYSCPAPIFTQKDGESAEIILNALKGINK